MFGVVFGLGVLARLNLRRGEGFGGCERLDKRVARFVVVGCIELVGTEEDLRGGVAAMIEAGVGEGEKYESSRLKEFMIYGYSEERVCQCVRSFHSANKTGEDSTHEM